MGLGRGKDHVSDAFERHLREAAVQKLRSKSHVASPKIKIIDEYIAL